MKRFITLLVIITLGVVFTNVGAQSTYIDTGPQKETVIKKKEGLSTIKEHTKQVGVSILVQQDDTSGCDPGCLTNQLIIIQPAVVENTIAWGSFITKLRGRYSKNIKIPLSDLYFSNIYRTKSGKVS